MLQEARRILASEEETTQSRVQLVESAGEEAGEVLGGFAFDAVLCHGVLPYLKDPYPLIQGLSSIAQPGAVVSVLAKNANTLAVRPALEGRYKDALAALGRDQDLGRLGVVTRGDTVAGLSELFQKVGIETVQWYGVRALTDHLGDRPPGTNLQEIMQLEWEVGRRDPYRQIARLIHLFGRKSSH